MNSDTPEVDDSDPEMAPCPRCRKQIDINHSACPHCGHRIRTTGISPLLIVGLIFGIPAAIVISGVLLLVAICAMG
ncbi:MAG: hypothetical protein JWP89_3228 [Schlesneria sp.]|nr:hypothetical protein [Schlesneria sp.]